jgi:3-hydroxyisobutyrate dehydrogenase-like beta-hydroxyacid dehydrogenase
MDRAAAANLWVVAAGPVDHLERCHSVFEAISQGLFTVGKEPWTANIIKIAGNFLIAAMLEALGEAFALVRKSGARPCARRERRTGRAKINASFNGSLRRMHEVWLRRHHAHTNTWP